MCAKCNGVHFCVVLQCVLQPIVVCWREPVLIMSINLKIFGVLKHILQWEACIDYCNVLVDAFISNKGPTFLAQAVTRNLFRDVFSPILSSLSVLPFRLFLPRLKVAPQI